MPVVNNMRLNITVDITISAPMKKCFEYIVPIELSHIFHSYLFIPGVKRTNETERWFKPGLSRTVYFSDGSRAEEHLLSVKSPESFTYRITDFTGINRLLVSEILGTWQFKQNSDRTTKIEWTYSLACHGRAARIIARKIVAPMLRNVLQRALCVIKQDLELK